MRALAVICLSGCYDLGDVPRPSVRNDAASMDGASIDGAIDGSPSDAPVYGDEVAYRAAVLADSPLAYWRLGETEVGQVVDETGVFHGQYFADGKPGLGVRCVPGIEGVFGFDGDKALRMDDGCEVSVPNSTPAFDFAAQAPFTIECWVYRQTMAGNGDRRLAGKQMGGEGYSLYDVDNAVVLARFQGGSGDPVVVGYPYQQWVHVAAAYDGTRLHLYIDGAHLNDDASASMVQAHTNAFGLGGANGSGFSGYLDECAVYDYALSPAQITARADLIDRP